MKKTKFAAALMIITAGSALISAGTAAAEEVEASRHNPGHMPPRREWRMPPHHRGPGRHMPPPNFYREPGRTGFYREGPGGHMPPSPPHGEPGRHMPPPPPPPRW